MTSAGGSPFPIMHLVTNIFKVHNPSLYVPLFINVHCTILCMDVFEVHVLVCLLITHPQCTAHVFVWSTLCSALWLIYAQWTLFNIFLTLRYIRLMIHNHIMNVKEPSVNSEHQSDACQYHTHTHRGPKKYLDNYTNRCMKKKSLHWVFMIFNLFNFDYLCCHLTYLLQV